MKIISSINNRFLQSHWNADLQFSEQTLAQGFTTGVEFPTRGEFFIYDFV